MLSILNDGKIWKTFLGLPLRTLQLLSEEITLACLGLASLTFFLKTQWYFPNIWSIQIFFTSGINSEDIFFSFIWYRCASLIAFVQYFTTNSAVLVCKSRRNVLNSNLHTKFCLLHVTEFIKYEKILWTLKKCLSYLWDTDTFLNRRGFEKGGIILKKGSINPPLKPYYHIAIKLMLMYFLNFYLFWQMFKINISPWLSY